MQVHVTPLKSTVWKGTKSASVNGLHRETEITNDIDSTVWKETGIYRRWRHPTVWRGKDTTTAIHGIKAVTFEREAIWRLPGTAPCLVRGVHPPVCWAPCRCYSWHRLSFCPAVRWEQTSGDCVPGQSILKKKILLSSRERIYMCVCARTCLEFQPLYQTTTKPTPNSRIVKKVSISMRPFLCLLVK